MIKAIKRYMINTRLRTLEKVLRNCEEEGWHETARLTRQHINEQRWKLFSLED